MMSAQAERLPVSQSDHTNSDQLGLKKSATFMTESRKLTLPKAMAASKGSLVLLPQSDDDWLFGKDSDFFKRTQWRRRKAGCNELSAKEIQTRKEETLKALTANIVDYGPDAKNLIEFLQTFAKSNDYSMNQPGLNPNDYLKNLQKQLSHSLQYSVHNMKLDVIDDPQPELPSKTKVDNFKPYTRHAAKPEQEITDFSSADTLLKNFTLFIPQHVLDGSKFMRKLNISDKEVVRYSVKSGRSIDKLLFEDDINWGTQPKSRVTFGEDIYDAQIPDTSFLSSLGSRTPSNVGSRIGSTRGVRFENEPDITGDEDRESEDTKDEGVQSDVESIGESSKSRLESLASRAKNRCMRNSKLREKVEYGSTGYLKRQRTEPSLLIRQRRNTVTCESVPLEETEKPKSIYGDMFTDSIRGLRDLNRLGKDAEDILNYVQQWQKEQNEKTLKEARDAINSSNVNKSEEREALKSPKPTNQKASSKKSKHTEKLTVVKKAGKDFVKSKPSSETPNSVWASRNEFDFDGDSSDEFEIGKGDSLEPRTLLSKQSTQNRKNLDNIITFEPESGNGPNMDEKAGNKDTKVKKKKKKAKEKKSVKIDPSATDQCRDLTIDEKIIHYHEEKQQKLRDLELKHDSVQYEVQSLATEVSDIESEIRRVLDQISTLDEELSEEEHEALTALQMELEEQLNMCRTKLESETKALWELRRERSLVERSLLLEDMLSEEDRESFVNNQERELEEKEVMEEAEMEENWELQRRSIIQSYEKRREDLQSSHESTRSEKLTPLSDRKDSLEEKRSELASALKLLEQKQFGICEEMDRMNEWYERELQKLRDELQSRENDPFFADYPGDKPAYSRGFRSKFMTPIDLCEEKRAQQRAEMIRREHLLTRKGSDFSKSFLYSYFSHIPQEVWMHPIDNRWTKMIKSASAIPPVKEGKKK